MNKITKITSQKGFTPLENFSLTGRAGFTLVELLVVIIIVGVLSALAVPIFRQNIRRVIATEGHALVGAIRTAQRIYFAENNKYTSNWVDIENTIDINNNKYFKTVPILTASGTGSEAVFTATVTGTGDASQISVSINQTGVMTTDGL